MVVLRDTDVRGRRKRGGDLVPVPVPALARFVNVKSWDVALAIAVELENGMAPSKQARQHTCSVSCYLGANGSYV